MFTSGDKNKMTPEYKTIKEKREAQFNYILSCIDGSSYGILDFKTDPGKLLFVLNEFKATHDYEIKRGGVYLAFADYLQGLPSCINIDPEYYKILNLAREWGYDVSTPSKEYKFLSNWWKQITNKFFMLCRKHKINYNEVLK
jgi:hypothetical protein